MKKQLSKLYNKIPKQVFNCSYIFIVILMIGSWVFTVLQVEELILLCTNNQTMLQYVLPLDYPQCNDNKFTTNSIIFTVGSFAYGIQMAFLAGWLKEEYLKRLTII